MLRSGLIRASFATLSTAVAACSGASVPSLPSLPEIAEALTPWPVVGPPTDIYARVARGALSCWFGSAGPLKADYVYHAEAQPASQGGKAEIVIHERDRSSETLRGVRAFRIAIVPDGEASAITMENLKLPAPLAKSMEADVRRWAAGAVGCRPAKEDWAPHAPEPFEAPETWKTRAKKGHAT